MHHYIQHIHRLTPNQHVFRMFKHFLVNNHAYVPYIQNLKSSYREMDIQYLGKPVFWICLAFTLSDAPQTYWSLLQRQWGHLYYHNLVSAHLRSLY